ncbi:MAG: OsmC family protein [Nitrospira sp.]|nr:OsmC family protein [Nitrospira sp.]
MSVKVAYKGGTRFDIVSRGHTIVTDQPIEEGGTDEGMGPVELFVGSLAGCVGYFVSKYCVRHGIACQGFTVDATWSMAEQPHRVGSVELHLRLPGTITPAQQERLLKVAHGCTVHQSLAVAPKVEVTVSSTEAS